MYAMERHQLIERLVVQDGRVAVVDLADRFGVTTETVRRDLDQLERAGALRRVHGGAVARERTSLVEPSLVERSSQRGAAKQAIAGRALDVLGDGFRGSVYIDAGTTTAAVATLLPARLAETDGTAEVVTHAMSVAGVLAGAPRLSLTVIGGRVRSLTGAAVGSHTVRAIEGLRPDVAFIGTNGISAGFGLSTPDPEEAAVKRAIVQSSRRVVVVSDAQKFDAELLVAFAGLDDIDVVVADRAPGDALGAALHEAGTEVWTA
ncbi:MULTISPECIES: DeoR/GlpR family DNA-binding transcription regulator [unclassified Microbacterium]|uniref:DeoR/GlpR family DNA-binding transcription regulator n=1 Tax=unclassified Microbacterium TaxID=2609290 RepID=UPI00214A9B33|nr:MULTISPECIES: DeoR/GlpR family DNA-binding transcription regulator [unclassified Microbacterium]MCR2801114.1 DeoR/GlpR family DNA-binding transcription regulator [Microbacterium sp. zg.Y818]MCR2826157.1 DeoR/GlpR family DNA-binding transcription regulator [Microbacterium sp. zg.Y909]WIM23814.1 DeoR/GlpR family DNA-binding transcription regulator [Microbacterium sp. zg-Y818]